MRVGIITHWWCFENYGQILQCYAYQRFLRLRGHDPFIIRYFPFHLVGDKLTIRRILRNMYAPAAFLQKIIARISGQTRKAVLRRCKVETARQFQKFKDERITYTHEVFKSYNEVVRSSEIEAECYSVGSDVVWKFVPLDDNGRIFFLDFGPKSAKRIAYSPSFGSAIISEAYKRFAKPLIKNLDYVSVRENSGIEICNELGRSGVKCVLDPVFLVRQEQWRSDFQVPNGRNGVFCYFLAMRGGVPISEIVDLCGPMVVPKITTVYDDMNVPEEMLANPVISDWVRLVGASSAVVTNSFHGTAMSIIMHTPFIAVLKEGGGGMDNRLISILDRVGLTSRIYSPGKGSLKAQMAEPIDWESVEKSLAEEIRSSEAFLRDAGL